MRLQWGGENAQERAAANAAQEKAELVAHTQGEPLGIGNEFSEIRVSRVETRNGSRLLIESPRSGQWVALCPLELEALTWQNTATFSAMIGNPFGPLVAEDEAPSSADGPPTARGEAPPAQSQASPTESTAAEQDSK